MAATANNASKPLSKHVGPEAEVQANLLFEKHSIEEIRNIEKKTRIDIERKKEDLRVMVGERYRDLIAAADTITEMKTISSNVMSSISNMEKHCKNLKQNYMVKGITPAKTYKPEVSKRKQEETRFYGTASQIKLLLDMPEKLWGAADSQDQLTATRLYLLSRHINTSLQLDSHHSSNIHSWFPVLTRQWAAISHFKNTILQGCRKLLKQPNSSDKLVAEALCSIMLLEDSTPRQVFNEFLVARTTAVQQIFNQHNASVKEQLCTVVQLISTTVHQIHAVFYSDQEDSNDGEVISNLLLKTLEEVTSKSAVESGLIDLQGSICSKCLPKNVTDFHPTLRAQASPVAKKQLHDNCAQWVNTCVSDVKTGVSKLLSYVNSVKRLADIRDAVWENQVQDESLSSWDIVCQRILTKSLSIWELFLRPLFLDRIKALVQYQFDTTVELTKRQLTKYIMDTADNTNKLMQQECDVSSYVWREMVGDIPTNSAWIPANNKSLSEGGGLLMKSKAFTPVIQSLCRGFDEKLKVLLEDTELYLQVDDTQQEIGPFDRFSDDKAILTHTQTTAQNTLQLLVDHMKQQLTSWEKGLKEIQVAEIQQVTCNKVLLIGRFCTAMISLTLNFKRSVVGPSLKETQRSLKKMTRSMSKSPEELTWTGVRTQLNDISLQAFRIWTVTTSETLVRQFSQALNTGNSRDILVSCTRWEEVEIQEETEDGRAVKSNIRVPMQASWYIQSLLYALCEEVNRVGGHALNRSVLQDVVNQTADGIVQSYEKLISSAQTSKSPEGCLPFTQQRALQAVFDLRFLLLIIPRKDDTQSGISYQKKAQTVISTLEEKVDPFDLDVFLPFIQQHLRKQAQRSAVLLGALTSLDKHGTLSTGKQALGGRQEQHNVLPLSTNSNRFPLLPLSTQVPRSNFGQPNLPQTTLKMSKEAGSSLSAVAVTTLPQRPQDTPSLYNKLGSMGQIWFSNIGGKTS